MFKILFIGSSKIVEEHIKVALELKFKLFSLNSTRLNSKNEFFINKKYKFEKKFNNWKSAVDYSANKKNIVFFIASRIEDTENILKYCSKFKNKIFVEKPITYKNKIITFNKNIFVGYNRLFFNSLKKINKTYINKFYCNVVISYTIFDEVKMNISHLLSILLYLFGDLKILRKIKNGNNINIILRDKKKNLIFFNILNTSTDSYSINIISKKINYVFKPLEILNIYNSIKRNYFSGNKKKLYVTQLLIKKFNEFESNNFKPGFLNQMINFKNFCYKKNKKIFNNINFANKVINLSHKILKR
tara:strand:- start:13289 stop:14194 length:906 start_codon:yes stop_codon:yes gene_type:complete